VGPATHAPPPETNMKKNAIENVTSDAPAVGRDEVMQMIGAARYADWLATQSASHTMQFLIQAQDDKLHLAAGCKTFEELLEKFRFKKPAYYRERKLLLAEGSEQYDLFHELGIPRRLREQLDKGDVVIKGNEVMIGGESFSLGESKMIKTVLERVVRDKIEAEGELAKATAATTKKDAKLKAVTAENQRLTEILDTIEQGTPFERAYLQAIKALVTLKAEIEELDHDERQERAAIDVPEFERRIEEIREAYGVAAWQTHNGGNEPIAFPGKRSK
jgi:hypothetical protein